MNDKIIQLIPATGWVAWYPQDVGEPDVTHQVAAFGLTESGAVVALMGGEPSGKLVRDDDLGNAPIIQPAGEPSPWGEVAEVSS